jgi:hypothetical protein
MSAPNNGSALPVVLALDIDHIQHLLFGLAYAKTIATVSKIDYQYGYLFNDNPSSLTFGDNYNEPQFKRWVMEEYKTQIGRLLDVAGRMTADELSQWLLKQWEIRQKFFKAFQETSAQVGAMNQRLQNLQLLGTRLAAVSLLASQFALVGLGIAPSLATGAQASMVGWSAWATASGKMALGVGTGLGVAIAQNWSKDQGADIVMVGKAVTSGDAKDSVTGNLKSGIPGYIDDLLAPAVNTLNAAGMKQFARETDRLKRMMVNASDKKVRSLTRKLNAIEQKGPQGAGLKGAAAKSMQALGYLFAVKSLSDASTAFVHQWNGEL